VETQNPWQSPQSLPPASTDNETPNSTTFEWKGHTISISAARVPKSLPLLEQCTVSIDNETFSKLSRSIYSFGLVHENRDVEILVEFFGSSIHENELRVQIGREIIHQSNIRVENSGTSQVAMLVLFATALALLFLLTIF